MLSNAMQITRKKNIFILLWLKKKKNIIIYRDFQNKKQKSYKFKAANEIERN